MPASISQRALGGVEPTPEESRVIITVPEEGRQFDAIRRSLSKLPLLTQASGLQKAMP